MTISSKRRGPVYLAGATPLEEQVEGVTRAGDPMDIGTVRREIEA